MFLLLCCFASFAEPTGDPVGQEQAEDQGSFSSVLEEAKQRYFQGEPDAARDLLEGLQLRLHAGEEPDWESTVEALTYLGEIYFVQGNQDSAEIVFRYLLGRDIETPISTYHHPIEVVNLFELVRAQIKATQPEPGPVPAPMSTYLPLGIPQLAQGRTGIGVVYGGLQAALGASSIILYLRADSLNGAEPRVRLRGPQDKQEETVDRLKRYQWPATFGFYTIWAISTIDAARWHQRHLGRQRTVTLAPGPGPGISVVTTF